MVCIAPATVDLGAGKLGWGRAIESVAAMAPLLMGEAAVENPFCVSKNKRSKALIPVRSQLHKDFLMRMTALFPFFRG
jgi:hypothetical protein